MRDAGMYTLLWKKYLPAIKVLLKKSNENDQKLLLYKHEFESTGARNKLGYVFKLELLNGKPLHKSNTTAPAYDLYTLMMEHETIAAWLKNQHVKIQVSRSYELNISSVKTGETEVLSPIPQPAVSE